MGFCFVGVFFDSKPLFSLLFKAVTAGCVDSDVTEMKWFISLKGFLLKRVVWPLFLLAFALTCCFHL